MREIMATKEVDPMRLCFRGQRSGLGAIPHTDAFEEVEIDGRRGVLLSSERPLPVLEACLRVDIPDEAVAPYALGPLWPSDYIIPLAIVQRWVQA
jgi:hypothetical protein